MKKTILFLVLVCSVSSIFSSEVPTVAPIASDICWGEACPAVKADVEVEAVPCCEVACPVAKPNFDEYLQKVREYNADCAVRRVHYMYLHGATLLTVTTIVNAGMLKMSKSKPRIMPFAVATTAVQFGAAVVTNFAARLAQDKIEENFPAPSLQK